MAWYRTGTASFTNGSATVTGSGTAFIANASIGEGLIAPDGRTYEITNIASDTSLTISPAYLGSTASGQTYSIAPLRGRIADLITETSTLLSSFANVRDGIGAGLFPDGSAATPAFGFANDQDTGIFRPGTNILAGVTAGIERWRTDASGNFGIRTTNPRATLDVGTDSSGASTSSFHMGWTGANFYGHRILQSMDTSTQAAGSLSIQRGSGVSWLDTLTMVENGNIGIGTNSPTFLLHVVGTSIWESACFQNTSSGAGANVAFVNGAGHRWDFGLRGDSETFAIRRTDGTTSTIVFVQSTQMSPGFDNAINLGGASFRWGTIYAATGTINTSDARDKHWRGELNAAELRAAKRIIGELGVYQWNDAVAEKGEDGARLHFGVRAQRAFAIMEDEGLDWSRYAWCCYDQWEEQTEPVFAQMTVTKTRAVTRPSTLLDPATGQPAMIQVEESYEETEMQPTGETRVTLEAGDRYGVRPDQLAFWLIAAQAAMQAELEARIAALEAAA